ncbi:MAG: hypothetical protein WAV90_15700 [Gordonia amarae]
MQNLTGRTVVRVITASVLAVFAMTTAFMSTGGAAAAPAPKPVSYKLLNTGKGVKMHVGNGTITSDDGWLAINDTAGRKVFTMPLSYSIDKLQFPIDIRHNGKYDAVLTPSQNKSLAVPVSTKTFEASKLFAEQDYAKKKKQCSKTMTDKDGYKSRQERDDAALNRVTSQLGTATAIGGFVGTAIGAIIGLAFAGIGMPFGATIGGIVGTLAAGGPTLVYAVNRYFTTLNTPFRANTCPR